MNASSQDPHLARFGENPDDRVAFEVLEERLFMAADWPALADLYRRRRNAPSLADQPRVRAELSIRLGQLLEDRIADADAAILVYTEAARLDPSLPRALQGLRRLYTGRRSWEVVLQIAEQEATIAESAPERARILSEMGDIWKRELGDPAQAEDLYARARVETGAAPPEDAVTALDAGDAAGEDGIMALDDGGDALEDGDLSTLEDGDLSTLDDGGDALEDGDISALDDDGDAPEDADISALDDGEDSLVQRGWLAAARGDTAAALAALERAVARDPDDIEALDMMLTVLEGAERHAEMAPLLERRARLAADPQTRGAVLVRLAEILSQTADASGSRDAYERAITADPAQASARAALLRLYRESAAWTPLCALLESAADAADGDRRVELLYELASVVEHELGDPETARKHLDRALELAPDDPRFQPIPDAPDEKPGPLALPELDADPAVGEQRSTRVVGVLERKLAAQEADGRGLSDEAVGFRLRIAELRGGALGEPIAAVEVLEPALENDDALLLVAPMLAGLYEQLGRSETLLDLAERAAAQCVDLESRVFWHRRAADTARALGDSTRAVENNRAVLADLPGDRTARGGLIDLYRRRGDTGPLIALLVEELPGAGEEREIELQLELATLHAESLGDAKGALPHLRRCIELDPTRSDLLEWALSNCDLAGGPLAQLDLIELATRHATCDEDRAALLARRGALLADTLAWQEEATESWREALALDPEQAVALERLAGIAAS